MSTQEAQGEPAGGIEFLSPGPRSRRRSGLLMAVVSAATFGSSGIFGSALLQTGWSPGAVALARIAVAALVLAPVALLQLRGRWRLLRRSAGMVMAYGLFGVVGCQVPFFYAIQSMQVGIAVLLEFTGAILVVGWLWARYRQRPRTLTIAGAAAAIAGLAMMAGITGSGGISGAGLMWGMLNAVSVAVYFFLSSGPASPGGKAEAGGPLSPVVLSWAGMCVGTVILAVLGLAHVMPVAASTRDVTFLGRQMTWVVPVIEIGVAATAAGYTAGIMAIRHLGPKLASFAGMSEVLFAALLAWAALGQVPSGTQIGGGVLILAGVALVRADESRRS
jgi:drug/metabolite transporter (DMT)-like permease